MIERHTAIDRHTAPHYVWGAGCDGWRLVEQPGVLSVIHERMPPGTSEVRHSHQRARQFFFVLSGTGTMAVGDRLATLGPQCGIEIGPGESHQMRNDGDAPVEFLVISTPPAQGDRVESHR